MSIDIVYYINWNCCLATINIFKSYYHNWFTGEWKWGGASFWYRFSFFLTFLNVINYIDRQLIGVFANWIVPELDLSNFEFGLITGPIFIFFYAVMGLSTMGDKLAAKNLMDLELREQCYQVGRRKRFFVIYK